MVELVIIACLVAEPETCQEFPQPEPVSEIRCGLLGQWQCAAWQGEHPKWQVEGWKCRKLEKES